MARKPGFTCPVSRGTTHSAGMLPVIQWNVVRVGLVMTPGRYACGRYRMNANGHVNDMLTPHPVCPGLGAMPGEHCLAYQERLTDTLAAEDLPTVRVSVSREPVYGNDPIKAQLR